MNKRKYKWQPCLGHSAEHTIACMEVLSLKEKRKIVKSIRKNTSCFTYYSPSKFDGFELIACLFDWRDTQEGAEFWYCLAELVEANKIKKEREKSC